MHSISRQAVLAAVALAALPCFSGVGLAADPAEARLLSDVRQLTFEGRRAGEGYFSSDGTQLIFQSEREPENPFYQIYLMDLETGDTRRVSPGVGKTTCAWIHPTGEKLLFASSHLDPAARNKQKEELDKRAAGKTRSYSWSFDEFYDIFEVPTEGGEPVNLTKALGYDAEGSWSPDGEHILFASNRHAYETQLSPKEQEILKKDASYFMELYIMKADGSDLRRLTDQPGYDGGPFFSQDGEKIVWRRFTEDGGSAEVHVMNVDGTGKKAITRLGAMSWAPYFHPSGDYVIFATSVQGFRNFELYMVDAEGRGEPVRVTHSEGFDGLPVFSPDGTRLSWSSSRTGDKKPQIFMASWNDAEARKLLGLDGAGQRSDALAEAPAPLPATKAAIDAADLQGHVEILASEDFEGRLTGTAGERKATAYVAAAFESLGLAPASDDGSYFQPFDFTAAVKIASGNRLSLEGLEVQTALDRDWRPLGLSANGKVEATEVVFAGYGIVAPAEAGQAAYDSYGALDVKDKWVLTLRYLPEDIDQDRRQQLYRYAELSYKAAVARRKGARGIIVASGPRSKVKAQLVPLSFEAAAAGAKLAAVSVTDGMAAALLATADKKLETLQRTLDSGETVEGFALPGVRVGAEIHLDPEIRQGRNVLARLPAGGEASAQPAIVIGAHVDHLGRGVEGKSLARPEEAGQVHPGADDNASGVAALLEIAQYLADLKARGKLDLKRALVFAAWSGEELGLLGSSHYVRSLKGKDEDLGGKVAAYLNMDMIGRLDGQLVLQGVGSSSVWPREIERRNAPVGLSISTSDSAFLATDATAFYLAGVPVLNAFTGPHGEYSTPRDRSETLNYPGLQKVARFMALVARGLATAEAAPDYVRQEGGSPRRRTSRVYLGTIPDYTEGDGKGTRISGVAKGGPAAAGGLEDGDIVVEMAGQTIANIYDYASALDALKVGEPAAFVVLRDGERVELSITPGARE
ncbi:MAG: M28 family peptidase [Kiloniellales bacterium]|nr:M28 family peptidase [Kiloniellales bacterium]MDJ0981055.1 M28 family peptidase [Kiloniellales bacterium]